MYLLSLFNAIVSISVVSSHINRCARYPQYSNYIKALLRTRIALAFSFFSDSIHQICNTNTQQIYLHLGSCITDTQNPNGNDIIYFILSHKYNSGLSDSYLILYTKYGCAKMRCTNNFRSNVSNESIIVMRCDFSVSLRAANIYRAGRNKCLTNYFTSLSLVCGSFFLKNQKSFTIYNVSIQPAS